MGSLRAASSMPPARMAADVNEPHGALCLNRITACTRLARNCMLLKPSVISILQANQGISIVHDAGLEVDTAEFSERPQGLCKGTECGRVWRAGQRFPNRHVDAPSGISPCARLVPLANYRLSPNCHILGDPKAETWLPGAVGGHSLGRSCRRCYESPYLPWYACNYSHAKPTRSAIQDEQRLHAGLGLLDV